MASEAVIELDEEDMVKDEKNDLSKFYDETFKSITEGEIVKGKVIRVMNNEVLIDVGYKSEGFVPLHEFLDPKSVKVGDEVNVLLEAIENQDGMVVLSKRKADRVKNWEKIVSAFEEGKVVEGRIVRRVKGGFSADIGLEAFLPASQLSLKTERDLDRFVGKSFSFKLIKINVKRKNVIVSRRAILEEEKFHEKEKLLSTIKPGQVRKGVIKNLTDFGAFIDLGGIDGLLHITDISWGRISHPSEVLSLGEEVEVMILDYDSEKKRISLGLKQRTANPWLDADKKYPVGKKVNGKVVNLVDYGVFIELQHGIEGLVHISEMSWTRRINHPSEMLSIGDVVEAVVLSMDKDGEKISLGMRQVAPNPWDTVNDKYPVGKKVAGKVRNITSYGAFVELESGVDGLIHISDMSWSPHISNPSEILKKADEVEAIILNVDQAAKKISLGIKQLTEDPWIEFSKNYKIGDEVEGKIVKIAPFGMFVEIVEGVEGLIHATDIHKLGVKKIEDEFSLSQVVQVNISKMETKQRKLALILEKKETQASEDPKEETGNTAPDPEEEKTQEQDKPDPQEQTDQ